MPGGKRRLKGLFTGGLQVGGSASPGDFMKHVLAGSVTGTVGSMGAVAGSTTCAVIAITGLTASHILVASEEMGSGNACMVFKGAKAGAGQASFQWAYVAGSGLGAVASYAPTIRFIATQV